MFEDTDDFYIDLARKNGVTEEITRVERFVPPLHGEHFASACISVTIHRKDSTPLELFVKKFTLNPYHQEMLKEMGLFDKEAGFFNVLLPELQKVVQARPDLSLPFEYSPAPKCFYASKEIIVMENLAKKNFELSDKIKRQSLEQARLVLKNLARFHAPSYILLSKFNSHEEILENFPDMRDVMMGPDGAAQLDKFMQPAMSLVSNLMKSLHLKDPSEEVTLAVEFVHNIVKTGTAAFIRKYFLPDQPHVCYVLNHGDCWNSNMLFRNDQDTKAPLELVFVDFQVVRAGSPNLDIGYYLFTSVKPEVRLLEWHNLLRHYYDNLQMDVQALGGNVRFTFEEFVTDFRRKFVMGFTFGLSMDIFFAADDGRSDVFGDIDKMEGDPMLAMEESMKTWVSNHPDVASKCAYDILAKIREYKDLLLTEN